MTSSDATKAEIRSRAAARRRQQLDKDPLSHEILRTLRDMSEFRSAATIGLYVDVRDEVRTRFDLPEILQTQKRVAVPYCERDELRLFHLRSMDELTAGAFGILEPRVELRQRLDRRIAANALEFVAVPGVAFDRSGNRLGHGFGYYDRLLAQLDARSVLAGLAFACQIVPAIPTESHDVAMDFVVTEFGVVRAERITNTKSGAS